MDIGDRRVSTMESPTKLTQFTPLSSEVKQPIGSFSFTRLFRRNTTDLQDKPPIASPSNPTTFLDEKQPHQNEQPTTIADDSYKTIAPNEYWTNPNTNTKVQSESGNASSSSSPSNRDRERDIVYTRSLSNVLRRISSIRDKRSPMPQAYKDSDFKQYWMPDSNCKECYECGDKFTAFRRRHHCRVCGQIFCSRCCNQAIPGKLMGYSGNLRVCTHCSSIVLSYIQSSELGTDLKTLQEELQNKLIFLSPYAASSNYDFGSRNSLRRKNSVGFREEEFARMRCSSSSDISSFSSNTNFMSVDQISTERKILAQDSVQLRELWADIQDPINGIEFQNHRHRLRTFPNCVVGSALVDWLLSMDKASNRAQATAIGQALIDAKLLECVTNQDQFFVDEYALYKPSQSNHIESPILIDNQSETLATRENQDPSWVKEICPDGEIESDNTKDDDWSLEIIESDPILKESGETERHMTHSSSQFVLDMNIEENRVTLSKPKSDGYITKSKERNFPVKAVLNEGKREFLSSLDMGIQLVHQDISHTTISDEFLRGALSASNVQQNGEELISPLGWHSAEHLLTENGEKLAFDRLTCAYNYHEQILVRQLLNMEGLSITWSDTILPLVHKVSEIIRPDVKNDNDEMDIRQYVQFKKIPGGLKSESSIVNGIVCSKNVAHKKMRNKIVNPNILILSSPIIYQRQENKFLSLDPLVMQEHSYLKNVVSKIASFKPDILLVEKTVSRLAQDFLLEQGISLVLNAKLSVIERVARCTQASIVSSVDAQITKPQLGMCHNFSVVDHTLLNGKTKTLMYFDGCATHLGCTVTLRGANDTELKKVKKIMQFMVYAAYNWRLERSFLMDEFALPQALPEEIPLAMEDEMITMDDDNSSVFTGRLQDSREHLDLELEDDLESGKFKSEEIENEKQLSVSKSKGVMETRRLDYSGSLHRCDSPSDFTDDSVDADNDVDMEIRGLKLQTQQVDDFSDPLHLLLRTDDDLPYHHGGSQLHVATLPVTNNFRKALEDVLLSCSPYMKFATPHLETEAGRNCVLRHYFEEELYWSVHFHKDKPHSKKKIFCNLNEEILPTYATVHAGFLSENVALVSWHPFVTHRLTKQFRDDSETRSLLADFRARGGRIHNLCPHQLKEKSKEQKNLENSETVENDSISSAGLMWERQLDALDPFYHQRLAVLFCSYSPDSANAPNFCVNPRVVNMDFYGCNDITLGGFLERYCFRQSYKCPSPTCETPMTDHIRKFAHGNSCVHIVVREMDDPSPVCQHTIVMWSWCRQCARVTPRVPMSMDSWSLSFAKYLELRFHGNAYLRRGTIETCTHSLHHEHFQYFGFKQRVVAFKYSPTTLREFVLPPLIINIEESPPPHCKIIEEIKHLAIIGNDVYSTVFKQLITMKNFYVNTKHEIYFSEMINQQKDDHNILREKIEEIQLKLTSPTLESTQLLSNLQQSSTACKADASALMWKIHDCVVNLKRLIADAATIWNSRIQEFIQQRKKEEKPTRLASGVARLISTSGSTSGFETISPKSLEDPSTTIHVPQLPQGLLLDSTQLGQPTLEEQQQPLSTASSTLSIAPCIGGHKTSSDVGSTYSEEGDVFCQNISDGRESKDSSYPINTIHLEPEISIGPESLSHSGSDPILMSTVTPSVELTDYVSSSPTKIEKKRSLTDYVPVQSFVSNYFQNDSPELEYAEPSEFAADVQNRKPEGRGHERSRSEGDGRLLSDIRLKLPPAKTDEDISDTPRTEKKTGTMKTMFTQILSSSTPADIIPFPFSVTEHHLLPPCEKVPVIVYDEEIGSIIAYALSSKDYELALQDLRSTLTASQKESVNNSPVIKKKTNRSTDRETALIGSDSSRIDSNITGNLWKSGMLAFFRGGERSGVRHLPSTQSGAGFESVLYYPPNSDLDLLDWEEGDEKEMPLYVSQESDKSSRTSNTKIMPEFHITVQFADSTAKFYCKVYFADHFQKLRKIVFPHGEEVYIRSLSRCINWQVKGGKSGLTFSKTQDDRFILKQMSRLELNSFMDFAPHYFQHIMQAFGEQKPTLLAKIIGVYRIGYRNSQTAAASKMDLLVMENLFYGHNITQKFDLKGSVRNRMVNTAGKQEGDLVLWDENLLKSTCDNPLYVRPHSKTVLTLAISNDTQFLSRQYVMDYSLLVGIDDSKQELVVGIIDYVRTFTFDKKIEMVVKARGFLGGQSKMPTVVSPELYRKRFCEAMERYFLHIPDRWSGLGRGVDS